MKIPTLFKLKRNVATQRMLWLVLTISFLWNTFAFSEEGGSVSSEGSEVIEAALPAGQENHMKAKRLGNQLNRPSDRIYKLTMRSEVVYKVQTTLGYFSTIDLPQPALKVFSGDQDYFKVEVSERQVLIKPVTDDPDARMNLLVFTESGRLAFEVTTGPPETADFVLDFRLPESDEVLVRNAFERRVEETEHLLRAEYEAKKEGLEDQAKAMAEEKLKSQVADLSRTIEIKRSKTDGTLRINLLSLSQIGSKGYLRFSVDNHGSEIFRPGRILLGAYRARDQRFRKDRREGIVEIPSEYQLPERILPHDTAYGVISFDYRPLAVKEKPFLRIHSEDTARSFEITGFTWFKD